jgi:competence protein ComEC
VIALHFMSTMLALVLAYNPQLVYNTGFQLSVAAVIEILLLWTTTWLVLVASGSM